MIRATLDTNVLASGVITSEQTINGQIIQAWRENKYTLILSEAILTEFSRTLLQPYFSARLTAAKIAGTVSLFRNEVTIVPISVTVTGVASHPEDDPIIATALSGKAHYLVTRESAGVPRSIYYLTACLFATLKRRFKKGSITNNEIFRFLSFLSNIPQQSIPLSPPWRLPSYSPYSPVSSLPFPLLAYRRCASNFLRHSLFSTLTRSIFVAGVTQVNSISVSPIQRTDFPVP